MGFYSWFERLRGGQVWYFNERTIGRADFGEAKAQMEVAKANAILLPIIQLIATSHATARWFEQDGKTLKTDSPALKLLKNPNPFQTFDDFQKQFIWYKYVYGYVHQLPISTSITNANDINRLKYLYNLKSENIDWGKDFNSKIITTMGEEKSFNSQKIFYEDKKSGFKWSPKVGDLISFYDLANGLGGNPLKSP